MGIVQEENALYTVALTMLPKIGPFTARRMVEFFGGPREAFLAQPGRLREMPRVGHTMEMHFTTLDRNAILEDAKREMEFVERNNLRVYLDGENDYPPLLKECPDAPLILFYRGDAPLERLYAKRWISVVGSRRMTDYGRDFVKSLLRDLAAKGYNLVVVSGLAQGVDGVAHESALLNGFPTVGVLGHGMSHFYPVGNMALARKMLPTGGLLTEFMSHRNADKGTFLQRNRIIAGLSSATIVVESAVKGGAMVTAQRALDYQRDVLALPGNAGRELSSGCNQLIKRNVASLVENADDLENALMWISPGDATGGDGVVQPKIFYEPTPQEQRALDALRGHDGVSIDELLRSLKIPINQLNAMMLHLEFVGLVVLLPGRIYRLK